MPRIKNIMKSFLIIFLLIFLLACNGNKKGISTVRYSVPKIDSLEGAFFYEGNVPYKCFVRNNQIEQTNNVIFYDAAITSISIDNLYQKGVFYFTYPTVISEYIKKNKISLLQNKSSIQNFEKNINFLIHSNDSIYTKTLFYYSINILSFKKSYAKIYYFKLGKMEQPIPDMKNYECCYSNIKKMVETFFITDIKNLKLY
jgi:hypothetical protein